MEQHSGMDSSSLKPRGDTRITYNIVYPSSSGKRTFSSVREYGAKDFLTFIFCGKNHEALCELNSQLKQEGMILQLNDTNVCCTVSTPITTNEGAILKLIFNEIQRSVLNIQEQLEFEEIRCPIEEPFLRKLMKSSAKRNNLLQMEEFEELDQNNCTKNHYLWLVYPRAYKDEITMCKCEAYYTKYSVPMNPDKAQILMSLGLLQAVKEHIKHDLHIEVDSSGIHIFALKHTLDTMIDSLLNFISEFDRSITSTNIGCPVQQHDVLLLPKVAEGLQNAFAFHNVFLQINMPKHELCLFARTEICLTDAVKVVKETLDELTVPITNEIGAVLQQDNWKDFMESVVRHGEKAEIVIKQTKQSLHIAGLKGAVENVKQFIIDLKEQNSRNSDVEMWDDDRITAGRDEGTQEKIPVNTNEGFNYIKKFYECSTKICLESYDTSHSQGFVLTGPKLEVQKARQKIEAMLSKVTINTYKFEDNGYFSESVGFDFLEAKVEKYCQVLFDFRPKHGKNTRSCHNESNVFGTKTKSHLDWEVNKELTLFKWKLDQGCQLVLAVTKVDTKEAEVVIETEEKKRGKVQTPQYSWSWNKKENCVKIKLPLPQYRPSAELDDVNSALKEVFERMVADGRTSVKVSIDSTATWPLECFVPRLLRVFLGCVRDPANKASVLNLSLLLCSVDGVNIEKAKKLCTAILEEGDGHFVSVRIVKGSLNETKADVLVNTAPLDLNLSNGRVSRSLLELAGREMQKEIYQKYRDSFTSDDIAVTDGYKLKCQYVFHGVLFSYDGEPANARAFYEESVHKFVTRCLNKAEELRCTSVAFPAIGTGRLQYPPEIVAPSMFLAVTEYSDEHSDTALEEVMFVVYPADTEALQAFEFNEKDMIAQKLEQNNQSSTVTIQLVGPEENIDQANQVIEDKLDWLKDKDADKASTTTVKIHGVCDVSYELLHFFHHAVIAKYEKKACQFNCEDDVLTIQANAKDSKMVETEIKQCLTFKRDLCKEEVTLEGIDPVTVEKIVKDNKMDKVCYVPDLVNGKVLLFGEVDEDVQNEKRYLTGLFKTASKDKSLSKSIRQSKLLKDTCITKNSEIPNPDGEKVFESCGRTKLDGKSTLKNTERSKPGMDQVKIDHIPFDLLLLMEKLNSELFQKCDVSYDSRLEQACIDMKHKKEFEKLLLEVRKFQTEVISLPETVKSFSSSDNSGEIIYVYNTDNATISVFGHDMKSVHDKVHQIKIDLGMVGKNERGTRQLTESFQFSDLPDSDDEKSQGTYYNSRGARPKGHSGQAQSGTYALPNQDTFLTNENIPVTVYTKNILYLPVDCIVNAANENLKHGGGIAEVISKAAGYELDKDCSGFIKRKGKLQTGEVYVSKPGKLKYKYVIHAVGPRWDDYKPHKQDDIIRCKRDLFMAVLNSFLAAEEKGMETIAVPAISSAVFKVPKDICTEMYAAAVLAYSKQASSSTRLREIHFIDSQPDIIRLIQGTFRKMIPNGPLPEFLQKKRSGTRKQVPAPKPATDTSRSDQRTIQHDKQPVLSYPFPYTEQKASDGGFRKEFHCFFSRMLQLIVSTGSSFDKQRADAAVCSENISGHGPGYIAKQLLEKGRVKYKSAKETAFRKTVKYGDVVVCRGEETGFQKVLHTVMWTKNPKDSDKEREDKFRKMFKAVLRMAAVERCQSIVMPLLFTGQGKIATDFCTERLLEACMEFSKEEKPNKLTVYLVNSEAKKTATIEKVTADFVSLQTVLRESSRDHVLPPKTGRAQSPKSVKNPSDHMNRHKRDQANIDRNRKPNFSRSQGDQKHHRNGAGVVRLSSPVKQQSVDEKASKSIFYVKDSTAQSSSAEDVEDVIAQGKKMEPDYDDDDDDDENGDNADKRGVSQDDTCVICMDTVNQPKKLKCGHVFCTDCIDNYFSNYKKVCPTCGVVCGVVMGDQPDGKIEVKFDKYSHCAGYEKAGSIIITYSFNSGTQGPDHPNPGKWFKGITRVGYLPDTKEGREVLKMLEVAFKRKLVFTIGGSRTTGQEGVITWNDIHHKTNPNPNTPFGYPDPSYLDRVKDELAAKGVTPDDIPASYRCN